MNIEQEFKEIHELLLSSYDEDYEESLDKALGKLDSLKKQLALCNVSFSLPSKEAVTLEAYKQAEEMKKQNDNVDKFAYSCGYIDGYESVKAFLKKIKAY